MTEEWRHIFVYEHGDKYQLLLWVRHALACLRLWTMTAALPLLQSTACRTLIILRKFSGSGLFCESMETCTHTYTYYQPHKIVKRKVFLFITTLNFNSPKRRQTDILTQRNELFQEFVDIYYFKISMTFCIYICIWWWV